jgi:hypothetical protein
MKNLDPRFDSEYAKSPQDYGVVFLKEIGIAIFKTKLRKLSVL